MTTKTEELEARIVALEQEVRGDNYDRFISEYFVPIDAKRGVSARYVQSCFVQWMIRRGYSRMAIANLNDLTTALKDKNITLLKSNERGDESAKEFVPDYREQDNNRLAYIGINVAKLPEFQTWGLG